MSIRVTWEGGQRFRATGEGGVEIVVDGETPDALSPMETLLVAVAGCMGVDVVDILTKGRQSLTACSIEVSGVRRETPPRRYTSIRMAIELAGEDLSLAKARRAVELSRTTYCSVLGSLAPDIDLAVTLRLRE